MTDWPSEPTRTFRFDVTALVARAEEAGLGFRVKLAADPTESGFVPLGTGFWGSSTPPGVRLVLAVVPGVGRN